MSRKTSRRWPFLKTLKDRIEHIVKTTDAFESTNLYFQDESRFGLKTHTGRCITVQGVKPKVVYQHKFKTTYLYGAYSPITGDSFVYEINGVDLQIFQFYLDEFSKYKPSELKIVVIDNAGFHSTKNLKIPDNIKLLNIPPYSPELNPCERMWHYIKSKYRNILFNDMVELKTWLYEQVKRISAQQVKSIVHDQIYVSSFNASFNT